MNRGFPDAEVGGQGGNIPLESTVHKYSVFLKDGRWTEMPPGLRTRDTRVGHYAAKWAGCLPLHGMSPAAEQYGDASVF